MKRPTLVDILAQVSPPGGGARRMNVAGLTFAVVLAAAALAVAAATEATTGTAVFTVLVLPVLLAAWFGGMRAGGAFVIAIAGVAVFAVIPPRWALSIGAADATQLAFFVLTSLAVILLVERLRRETERTARLVEELERSNEAKTEFVQHVSHELRAPMTIIRGNADILAARWDSLDAETRAGALGDVRDAAVRLEAITANLLSLARVDAGQRGEREPVIVAEVAHHVLARHRKANPLRQYEMRAEGSRHPVICVPGYLAQVIENLLSNAEKYSPPDEPITVVIRRTDTTVGVSVLDRGKGFRPEQASALFDPFYRADDTGDAPGLGIGLSVCKRFAEAEGGSITARPREGGGAEFTLTLPAAAPDTPLQVEEVSTAAAEQQPAHAGGA